jgi:CelD/BcsL family acetyltransferase involved in cellulose biosynthesis
VEARRAGGRCCARRNDGEWVRWDLKRRGRLGAAPAGRAGLGQAPGQLRLVELAGPAALNDAAEWVERVHGELEVSLLAGRRWLESWTRAFPRWEPWVLTLLDEDEPLAVAPLTRRRGRSGFEVVSIGADQLNESPVVARDELGTAGLAASIARALESLDAPWSLRLPQLPSGSPLTAALQEYLGPSIVDAGSPRPVMHLDRSQPAARMLTANTRSALAKARNRIARDRHRLALEWVEDWGRIRELLPEIMAVHRARDLELRGMSLLDDPEELDFYQQVLVRHAERWRVLVVRIDGALAGYAICLADERILRVWDNRVSPDWRRYSAGLIANAEVLTSAGGDPAFDEVDWGCGMQRYKGSMSNEVVTAETLRAWSSGVLRARRSLTRRLHARGWLPGGV